jgi:hypothetical protein
MREATLRKEVNRLSLPVTFPFGAEIPRLPVRGLQIKPLRDRINDNWPHPIVGQRDIGYGLPWRRTWPNLILLRLNISDVP